MPIGSFWNPASFSDILGGMPQLGQLPTFKPVDAPGLMRFGRFGESDIRRAEGMLQPQLELALANARRREAGGLAGVGAASAAGGLPPAAAAALAMQQRARSGEEVTGVRTGFAGAATGLAGETFGRNLAATSAEQEAEFGLFDRLFGQEQFGAEFGRQTTLDEFFAEIQRNQTALGIQQGQGGSIWDMLTGLAGGAASGGLSMLGQQKGFSQLMAALDALKKE